MINDTYYVLQSPEPMSEDHQIDFASNLYSKKTQIYKLKNKQMYKYTNITFTNIQIYKYKKCTNVLIYSKETICLLFHCSKLVWKLWLRQTKSRQA